MPRFVVSKRVTAASAAKNRSCFVSAVFGRIPEPARSLSLRYPIKLSTVWCTVCAYNNCKSPSLLLTLLSKLDRWESFLSLYNSNSLQTDPSTWHNFNCKWKEEIGLKGGKQHISKHDLLQPIELLVHREYANSVTEMIGETKIYPTATN